MKQNKSFDKWIGILSISVISIVAIVFVVIISDTHLAKGTYAADDAYICSSGTLYVNGGDAYCCTCSSGQYKLDNGTRKCVDSQGQQVATPQCFKTTTCNTSADYVWTGYQCRKIGDPCIASGCYSVCGTINAQGQCVKNSSTPDTNGSDSQTYQCWCFGLDQCRWAKEAPATTWHLESDGVRCSGLSYPDSSSDSGTFCRTPGKFFQDDTETCETCPKGYYCPGDGSIKKCQDGTTDGTGAKAESECISSVEQPKTVTLTFKSNDGKSILGTQSCTIPANSNRCASDLVAPSGSIPEISGKVFNGWGESAGCTAGSYTANATFAITRDSSNRIYYACYKTADSGNKPADFDSSKCSYSALTAVTRDERYLNCKYTNISYNNDQSADTAATIQACCQAKGYTWVGSNFTSSGFGNEYCIVCSGGTTPGGNGGDSTPTPSSSTDTGACYLVNHKYVWSANSLSGGTLVNSITSKSNCNGCEKGYTLNSSNNCVKSSSSSTTPSNSSSKEPTNPQTGMTGIVLAWIIGLLAIGYSFWYFKRTSTN